MYSYSDYKGKLSESEFNVATRLINAVKSRGYGLQYSGKTSISCDDLDTSEIIAKIGRHGEFFSVSEPDGSVFCNISLDVSGGDGCDLISSVNAPHNISQSYWDIIDMIVVEAEGNVSPSNSYDFGM